MKNSIILGVNIKVINKHNRLPLVPYSIYSAYNHIVASSALDYASVRSSCTSIKEEL